MCLAAWLTTQKTRPTLDFIGSVSAGKAKHYKIVQMSLAESSKELPLQKPGVGDLAPEFELRAVTGAERHNLNLEDYRGKKHIVLAFYVANWTPV